MTLSYFIRTFGCQMNVADSLAYARVLENLGCVQADSEESADILIVNTCSVRAKAEERAISYIGAVNRGRAEFSGDGISAMDRGIALVGCMATVRGDEIKRRFPEVRVTVTAREIDKFEDRILSAWPTLAASVRTVGAAAILRPVEQFERFLPVVRGCINRCTYCIVPTARGDRIESLPPSGIIEEVDNLINSGVKAITFLGQNVLSYGTEIDHSSGNVPSGWESARPGYGFADLLADIRDRFADAGVWFKFLTSHSRDVNDEFIDVIASDPVFSRHFHLPLQAGDDEVLKRMGRGYTSAEYLSLISKLRSRIPGLRLTTDIIVGFPGEDENAFERTMDMLREIRFDAAFTFLYSPRSGTPAEKWADPVPRKIKSERLQRLIELQNRITLENAKSKIGETRRVLVEGPAMKQDDRDRSMVAGITREEEVVILKGDPSDYGSFTDVELTGAGLRSFTGERVEGA
jgi:tRNA-2-methylthio-N6-dimethylallyladenosine synthase